MKDPRTSNAEQGTVPPRTKLWLGGIILASALLGALMLTRDLPWSDDWAGYFMQSRALVEGRMQEFLAANSFAVEQSSNPSAPVTYPWGYPIMLAPAVALAGFRILGLKLILTLAYAASLVPFFLLARTRVSETGALILTAGLAFNPTLLLSQNDLYADIPFLFFTILGLWLIEKYVNADGRQHTPLGAAIAIGFVSFYAYFIRINGLLLVLALLLSQIRQLRRRSQNGVQSTGVDWLAILVPYGIIVLLHLLQAWALPFINIPVPSRFARVSLATIQQNILYYFWLPAEFFEQVVFGARIVYLLLLAAFAFNVSRLQHRDLPIYAYGLATLGGYILFPAVQGPRYIAPILPLFLLFSFAGMQELARRLDTHHNERGETLVRDAWIALAFLSAAACIQLAWGNLAAGRLMDGRTEGAFSSGSTAMFDYVRDETSPDSVIIFWKPRSMYLRTGRQSFQTTQCADFQKGDFLVLFVSERAFYQVDPSDAPTCNPSVSLVPVYDKYDFRIYQIVTTP